MLLELALVRSETVRALHASDGVDARKLSQAVEAQRAATQAVVDRALKLAEAAGQSTGATLQRRVLTTVQGWLTGAGDEPPGRMTHEVEPSGFGAVLSVGAAPKPLPTSATAIAPPAARAKKEPPDAAAKAVALHAAKLAEAKQQVGLCERQARDAHKLLQAHGAAEAKAREALVRTQKAVQEAEKALAERRTQEQKQTAELSLMQRALGEAQLVAERTELALEQVRTELARLSAQAP
jgi:hypothetical protein